MGSIAAEFCLSGRKSYQCLLVKATADVGIFDDK